MGGKWPWLVVCALWLGMSYSLVQTTQGTYEDHLQVDYLLKAGPRTWHDSRVLSRFATRFQLLHGHGPRRMRAAQLGLSAGIAGVTGLMAVSLGLSALPAVVVMALHPLGVETIVRLTGRDEQFAALFVLLGCLLAIRPWRVLNILGMIVCGVIGYRCKESASVALVLFPLTAYYVAQTPKRVTVLVLACSAWLSALLVCQHVYEPLLGMSALRWAVTQSAAVMRLVRMAILPLGQTVDYDYDALSMTWRVGSSVALVAMTACAGWLWKHRETRTISFGVIWIVLVSLPRLIVQTPKSYLNEHQFYLALVGVAIIGAGLVSTQTVVEDVPCDMSDCCCW